MRESGYVRQDDEGIVEQKAGCNEIKGSPNFFAGGEEKVKGTMVKRVQLVRSGRCNKKGRREMREGKE